MTNTWKDYLLKSSIPLEFEVKKFLDSRGCICDFEYSYLRLDENSIPKEFSYDIDASYIRDEHFVELMIECKYRHQSTKWVFIPEKYGGYQEVYPNSFMHPNDHFCRKKKFRYSSSFPIELASLCIKGIEINTSGHDTKSISHAVSQLSYAFSQKVVSGMEHQIEQLLGSSDFIFYNVPVIVTTASLFRLKNDVSISAIQKSKELSEIAEECDCLVLKSRRGLDLENYNNGIFNDFVEKYGLERLNKQLNSFNKDIRFVLSVIAKQYCPQAIVIIKHTPDNRALSHLIDYINELFNPSKETLKKIESQKRRLNQMINKLEKKSKRYSMRLL